MNNQNIDNWKLFLALQDASEHMWDWGHRLNPQFHQPLGEVIEVAFDSGFGLDFSDGAIQAFFRVIDFPSNPRELSIGDIVSKLRFWADQSRAKGIHGFDQAGLCASLLATRNQPGWSQIDALLNLGCGIGLSRFFNTVASLYIENEPGLGGDTCYRLKIGTSTDQDMHWFAVSSSLEGITRLFGDALSGQRLAAYLAGSEGGIEVSPPRILASILRNDSLLFTVPMRTGDNAGPVWSGAHMSGRNFDLIHCLAGLAPKETIMLLKGRILEADLGL